MQRVSLTALFGDVAANRRETRKKGDYATTKCQTRSFDAGAGALYGAIHTSVSAVCVARKQAHAMGSL